MSSTKRKRVTMTTDQNLFHMMIAMSDPNDANALVAIKQETIEIEEEIESEPEELKPLVLKYLKEDPTDERPNNNDVSHAGVYDEEEYFIKKETTATDTEQAIVPGTWSMRVDSVVGPLVGTNTCGMEKEIEELTKKETRRKGDEKTSQSITCKLCGYKSAIRELMRRHMLVHTVERTFKCQECPSMFKANCQLKRHMLTHADERPFQCQKCPSAFKSKDKLNRHMLVHTNVRPFQCQECPSMFKRKDKLKFHMLGHTGERPFQCQECQLKFKSKYQLTSHLVKYACKWPFQCQECPSKFKRKCELKYHTLRHS